MNKHVRESIPPDHQAIAKEEGEWHQPTSRGWVETSWAQEGTDENTADTNMECADFSSGIRDALFQTGPSNVLPRWVERTDGPGNETAPIHNEQPEQIIGVGWDRMDEQRISANLLPGLFRLLRHGCRADG